MASDVRTKRMMRERVDLAQNTTDYFVHFKDDDLFHFDVFVLGPDDTLYEHKLVKLHFEIPSQYPLVPPKVKFVEHDSARIHPNLYVEGKVCLSILGTWPGEPWAFAMNCNTVLITIRSLLDNKPYMHEPLKADNPSFNQFVQYATWKCLLLDYLDCEQAPAVKKFLQRHVRERGHKMLADLARQEVANRHVKQFTTPYREARSFRHSQSKLITPNYPELRRMLKKAVDQAECTAPRPAEPETRSPGLTAAVTSGPSPIASTFGGVLAGSKRSREEDDQPEAKRQQGIGGQLPNGPSSSQRPPSNPAKTANEVIDLTDD